MLATVCALQLLLMPLARSQNVTPVPPASADTCQVRWFVWDWTPANTPSGADDINDYNPVKYGWSTAAGWWVGAVTRHQMIVHPINVSPEIAPTSQNRQIYQGVFRYTGQPGGAYNASYAGGPGVKAWAVQYKDSAGTRLLRSPAPALQYYVNSNSSATFPAPGGENNAQLIDLSGGLPPPGYPDYPQFDLAPVTIPADGILDVEIIVIDPNLSMSAPLFETTDCLQTIDAVDDDFGTVLAGSTTAAVLVNDTLDNTKQATTSNVTITQSSVVTVPPGGAATDIILNVDGTVTVGTSAVNGVYELTYTICETGNLTLCESATVTLDVQLLEADLSISKTNTPGSGPDDAAADTVVSGASTSYSIVVSNAGPAAADGAILTDPAPTGMTCTAASCGSETGGAACPAPAAMTVVALQAGGVALPTLPAGGSLTVSLDCTVD